jgi:hypothetical protein
MPHTHPLLFIFSGFLSLMHVNVYSPKKIEHFPDHDDAAGSLGFEAHRLSQRQRFTPFPYDSRLSTTIHAFLRQTQTWTKHDVRPAIENKLKTPFPKTKKQNVVQEAKARAATVPNPKYGGAARI